VARVRLIDAAQAPLLARPYYATGDPGPIVSALAHVPEFLEVAMPFVGTVLGPSSLDARTKELVILRTSAVARCRYCVGTHTVVALDLGLTRDEIEALRGERRIDEAFPPKAERAVLAWVDAVAGASQNDVASAREALATFYDDADVVELTVIVATTLMLNRLCTALDLPLSARATERMRDAGLG
jgi:AhpD family alkylhydroperoxidase